MRIKLNKEIEFYIKKFFFSETYLLKKRLSRAYKKGYEEELYILDKITPKNLDSIDVGVYRGVYTFVLAKISKHVHAFEPNPLIYTYLKKNLTKLIKNITLYNYAISDKKGETDLRIPKRSGSIIESNFEELYKLGCATIHSDNVFDKDFETFKVKTVKLDEILSGKKIGFIKIDVEGHEKRVIDGAANIIKKYKPNLLVEIEKRHSKENVIDTIQSINNLGYKSFFYENNELISTRSLKDFNLKNNYIFIP